MLYLLLMMTAFLGYVIAWGQVSFWGGTVISNIFLICNMTTYILGGTVMSGTTLIRFFILHFLIPFLILVISLIHFFYLHSRTSNNILAISTNNSNCLLPYIMMKDILSLLIVFGFYMIQLLQIYSLAQHDNSLEVNVLNTPLHITPEWYFLHLYLILKVIPNKTSGILLLIVYIIALIQMSEVKSISITVRLSGNNNLIYGNLFISFLFIATLMTIFLGAQLPSSVFIMYGRILLLFSVLVYYSNLWFPYPILTNTS